MQHPERTKHLHAIYPLHVTSYGTGQVAYSLVEQMQSKELSSTLTSLSSDSGITGIKQNSALHGFHKKVAYRIYSRNKLRSLVEKYYFKSLARGDIAYLWPGCSLELYQALKDKGHILVVERINCHRATADTILRHAEKTSDIRAARPVVEKDVMIENRKLDLADVVFAPSPLVRESLIANRVAGEKIITSSYGLNPSQLVDRNPQSLSNGRPTAIFVGRVGLRKGSHLLIKYWQEASVDAKLVFIGQVEQGFRRLAKKCQSPDSIEFMDFAGNVPRHLAEASFYVMPSLEEGSPLATYEALGAGLPCLVSPMGGGGVVLDKRHGRVLDPYDRHGWVSAIREFCASGQLLASYSKYASKQARQLVWNKVSRFRLERMLEILD